MEKKHYHYALSRVKKLIKEGNYRVTRTAFRCAARDCGYLEAAQLADCVLRFQVADFYESMTTPCDSMLWQDVYRPSIEGTPAYVKVQIVADTTVVISFSALEDN